MFLHLLGSGSMFTKDFYKMMSYDFSKNDHCFLGSYPDYDEYMRLEGCKIVKSASILMPYYLYKSDYIIVHGLFNKTVILMFALQPWLLKKSNWIVWGADIYGYNKKNKSRFEKILEKLKKFIAPKFGYISTFTEGDWNLAKEWYGVRGKHQKVSYPLPGCNAELVKSLKNEKKSDNCINILLGNSATDTNQHFEALDWLSFLKDENIQIYIPLNYGMGNYKEYAEKVIRYAENIFGGKIHPLTEKLDGESYLRFLNTIDVGLFNNNRQQGMGNITQAILCGAKVYIRKDTIMWEHYRNLGCTLLDIEDIKNYKTLDELVNQELSVTEANKAAMAARQDMNLKKHIWENIFDTMRSSK